MPRQNSLSATCTTTPTTQSSRNTCLQYTEKGIQLTSLPSPPTADQGYTPPFKARSIYAFPDTVAKKKEEAKLAKTFPASGISDSVKPIQRSQTFPKSDTTSEVTDASVWRPIDRNNQEVPDCVDKSEQSPEYTDQTCRSAMSASTVNNCPRGKHSSMSPVEAKAWKEFCDVTSRAG